MKTNNFSAPVSAAPIISPMGVPPPAMWGAAPTMPPAAANWNNNPFMASQPPQGMMQPMVSAL